MSDYTPTTMWVEAAWGRCRVADGAEIGEALAEFRRFLAAHDAEVRADERFKVAEAIFDEELVALDAARSRPVGEAAYANGRVAGLQRARDIAAARGDGAE